MISLQSFNTFGLEAQTSHYYPIHSQADLLEALLELDGFPFCMLGGGSNVILQKNLNQAVLHLKTRGLQVIENTEKGVIVEAQAGEPWDGFVQWTLEQGWGGLENLRAIPGTVGAAPIQNIGAYGVELADRFDSLEALDTEYCEKKRFSLEECEFAYRDSYFKKNLGRWIILSVRFFLPRPWLPVLTYGELKTLPPSISPQALGERVADIRREKLPDPAIQGNAGSFFKNPIVSAERAHTLLAQYPDLPHYPQPDGHIKLAAGWLIEHAGLKGKSFGKVGVHPKQALVLVNLGGAEAEDVLAAALKVQKAVLAQFAVMLEQEPIVI